MFGRSDLGMSRKSNDVEEYTVHSRSSQGAESLEQAYLHPRPTKAGPSVKLPLTALGIW